MRTHRHSSTLSALIALIALALLASGCGGDGDGPIDNPDPDFADETVAEATVEQVVRDPENWDDNPVLLRGQAYPLGDLGFLLASDGKAILVTAAAGDVERLESGEEVAVRGELSQIGDRAADLREALKEQDAPGAAPAGLPADDVDRDTPTLKLRVLRGAGPGEPPSGPF